MAIYVGPTGQKEAETNLISLSQIADGDRIARCLDIVENLDTTRDLSNYRLKSDKITSADLDELLIAKINKEYDDTAIKGRIGILESIINEKADRCDLSLYRRENDLITQYDLDDELIRMIKSGDYDYIYDDTEIRSLITALQLCKTETSESGFIVNLTEGFKDILAEKYTEVNIINALNFLFHFVNFYSTLDLRFISEPHNEVMDMGSINADVTDTLDMGRINPITSLTF